ncbi:hypothetical protein [Tessaracoccus aquimaris]|nr:hypothetical protein [Tessaracoccus aquimaris]
MPSPMPTPQQNASLIATFVTGVRLSRAPSTAAWAASMSATAGSAVIYMTVIDPAFQPLCNAVWMRNLTLHHPDVAG